MDYGFTEEESLLTRKCGNMAGRGSCAKAILRSLTGKSNGCPSFKSNVCTCRHTHNPIIDVARAQVFLATPVVALRYIGERKNERQKWLTEEAKQLTEPLKL